LGTQASWSRKGDRLVYLREIYGEGERRDQVERQEVVMLAYKLTTPVIVYSPEKGQILRSPVFSPDGTHVAFFLRRKGTDPIWDLYVRDVRSQLNDAIVLAKNVVIEGIFEHVGPAWSSDSQVVYGFTQTDREEEYYPLQWWHRSGKDKGRYDYPKKINVANDLHCRTWAEGDLVTFTGIDRGPREVYVAVLPRLRRKDK
jgi:Tol biopolymer transport system component